MAVSIGNAAALAACDAIAGLLDGGFLRIYSGAAPADPDAAASGTLLAELTLTTPAFGAAVDTNPGAEATANAITSDTSANASGTAGYFRAYKSDGVTCVLQGTVTATGGGGDLELNSTSITAGGEVAVTSFKITVPES